MSCDHTIKPTTLNVLGSSPRIATPSHSPYTPNAQEDSTPRQSLWGRLKSKVKKVFGYIKSVVTYFKVEIVPIAIAAAGVMNAWSNYRRCTGKARDAACCA